jgi:nucleoside-diphosphate-sugar epimerase
VTRTIAVTGGTGFLGAAVIAFLINRGDSVRALVRGVGRLAGRGEQLIPVEGALGDDAALARLVDGADAVIHCAGLTHARRDDEFRAVNGEGAGRVAAAAASVRAPMIHISSIAARQPELSAYAASKRAGEDAVRERSGANRWAGLRAPAIYGPGDAATLPYFRLVKSGIAPEPAAEPPPRASILYVDDVAAAAVAAADSPPPSGVYDLGDEAPDGRTWREIGETLARAIGVRARRVRAPRPALALYASAAAGLSRAFGGAPMVTPGKIAEFFHPDWVARDPQLGAYGAWRPRVTLDEGFAKAVRWYQDKGLL